MDTNDDKALLAFRKEYEESGMTKAEFSRVKGMEYWKANYALRKALRINGCGSTPKVKFRKIAALPVVDENKDIVIRTSQGVEIRIPS